MYSYKKFLATAAASCLVATSAAAQSDYPSKTIEIIVGYNAGGPVDTVTRAAAPFIEKHLGGDASVAVINKPGAAGTVASIDVSNSEPDGYTLMMFSYPAVAAAFYGVEERGYTMDDFDFLGTVTADPHNLFVSTDSEFETLDQFVEAAEATPDDITVAAAGVGGAAHLGLLVFERASGVDVNYIPAAGGAGTLTQVLGGHVQGGVTTLSALVPYVVNDDLRILASFGAERNPVAPDVPTAREQGVDMQWGAIRGVAAPAGLPEDVRDKLAAAVEATMNDPEFLALAEKQGIPLEYITGEQFLAVVENDVERLDQIWEETPWR